MKGYAYLQRGAYIVIFIIIIIIVIIIFIIDAVWTYITTIGQGMGPQFWSCGGHLIVSADHSKSIMEEGLMMDQGVGR